MVGPQSRHRFTPGRAGRPGIPAEPSPPADAVDVWIATGIAALVFLLRLPGLGHGFVLLDDLAYVVENPIVRDGWSLETLRRSLTAIVVGNWHPLTLWSHMTDVELWGLKAGPHVMTNVALHALAAALFVLLFRRYGLGRGPSGLAGALFAFHPVHVESYAWVSERKDVLSAVLFLATLHAWGRWTERRSRGAWALALGLFGLALAAKPMVVTLPALLLVLDLWPRRDRPPLRALVLEKLPFFLLSAAASVTAVHAQRALGALRGADVTSVAERLEVALAGYSWYLRTWFLPRGLAVFHPWEGRAGVALAADAALLVLVSVLAWRLRRAVPAVLVGWLWFLGMLVPVSGLAQVGLQAVSDRYLYLPAMGLVLGVVSAGARLGERGGPLRKLLVLAAALWVLSLAALSQWQFARWSSSVELFTQAVAVHPRSAFAHYLLGLAQVERKDWGAAGKSLGRAIELQTGGELRRGAKVETWLAPANVEMSRTLRALGRPGEAVRNAEAAVTLAPADGSAWLELGDARLASSGPEGAEKAWRRAADLGALDEEGAGLRQARAALARADVEGAARLARAALGRFPSSAGLWQALSVALARSGRPAEALEPALTAARLDPSSPEARLNAGILLAVAGRGRESADELAAAVRLDPEAVEPRVQLALSLVALGRRAEAVRQLEEARRIDGRLSNDYLETAASLPHATDTLERLLRTLREPGR